MSLVVGVDEAGRGPVIGPMVLALVGVSEAGIPNLVQAGARDSKRLSRRRRAQVFEAVLEVAAVWDAFFLLPVWIDRMSLTCLVQDVLVEWIRRYRPAVLVCDALGSPQSIPNVIHTLRKKVSFWSGALVMKPNAEAGSPVVAAASIIAKVLRDDAIAWLRAAYGDFGWGYPSETRTRRFLQTWFTQHGRWPIWVRTKWATCRTLVRQPW